MKTREEKEQMVKKLSGDDLLNFYDNYSNNFDPIDFDTCESFNVCREEIKRRLEVSESTSDYFPTEKEMEDYLQEFFGDDSQEYDSLVDMVLDEIVRLDSEGTPAYAFDDKLMKYVRGLLEDYLCPSFFANWIANHAKEIYASL